MEINGTNPLIVLNNKVQRLDSTQQPERALRSGIEHPESDRLEISARSREISHLNELIQSTPDIREEKVEQLRRELEGGTGG